MPKPQKTEAEALDEERKRLGLPDRDHVSKKKFAVDDEDCEIRYEIGKLSSMASKDLDLTAFENHIE